MTKPNDIPQDVWHKASCAYEAMPEISGDWDIVGWLAALIYAAKEEEREECARVVDGFGDAIAKVDERGLCRPITPDIAAAIRNQKLANNTNKD